MKAIRFLALFAMVQAAMAAAATDLYSTTGATGQDSVMQDARPGEYYYNLAADAVRHRDYAHAVDMYQVSASWAYKTSEYNLGVMYARGEGVPVDMPRAMAWMALAAERSDKHYVEVRDLIAAQLDKEGLNRAQAIVQELLPTYGDAVALNRAKARWRETRNEATGSHLGYVGNLQVGTDEAPNPATDGEIMKVMWKAAAEAQAKQTKRGSTGSMTTSLIGSAEIAGVNAVDGSKAYHDLQITDDPYDPKLERGVAVVGPVKALDDPRAAGSAIPSEPTSKKN